MFSNINLQRHFLTEYGVLLKESVKVFSEKHFDISTSTLKASK